MHRSFRKPHVLNPQAVGYGLLYQRQEKNVHDEGIFRVIEIMTGIAPYPTGDILFCGISYDRQAKTHIAVG